MAKFSEWVGRVFKLTDSAPFLYLFGGGTYTGRSVTPDSALTLSTVFACVRLLSETIGSLPIHIFRKEGDGVKERDDEHPLYPILHDQPNGYMSAIEFKEALMLNLLTSGNAFAEIERNVVGDIIALNPLLATKMDVERLDDGTILYKYLTDKGVLIYDQTKIFHLRLFGWSGLVGLSPIAYGAQGMGLALAAEEYGARFYGQGARPSGFLMIDRVLTPEQREKLREQFDDIHEGLERSHKLAILEANMKYQQVTIAQNDAQFLETRSFQVPEVCRFFLVQPHKVQHLEHATFSNIEHQDLEFVKFTVNPYLVKIEQGIRRQLITADDRAAGYFAEFNVNALLRGDSESRAKFYSSMVQNGIFDRNEVRALENRPPREGAGELTVQSNMIDLDDLEKLTGK